MYTEVRIDTYVTYFIATIECDYVKHEFITLLFSPPNSLFVSL